MQVQDLMHLSGLEILNKQYLASSKPCGCIFCPRNFGFRQEIIFPNNHIDGGRERTQTSPVAEAHVTPLIMSAWLQVVRQVAGPLLFPRLSSVSSLFVFFPRRPSSTLMRSKSLRQKTSNLCLVSPSEGVGDLCISLCGCCNKDHKQSGFNPANVLSHSSEGQKSKRGLTVLKPRDFSACSFWRLQGRICSLYVFQVTHIPPSFKPAGRVLT